MAFAILAKVHCLAWLMLTQSFFISASTVPLKSWKVVSSTVAGFNNVTVLSSPDLDTRPMYTLNDTKGTLMSTLLYNGVFNETHLFYSENLKTVDSAQFKDPWFYRHQFGVKHTPSDGNYYTLKTNGISSKADIWLNGQKIADKASQAGSYVGLEYDISDKLRFGGQNEVLVVKVYPTDYDLDLAVGFVDWNPPPPDNGTGIWRDVELLHTGPVRLTKFLVNTDRALDGTVNIALTGTSMSRNASTSCRITCVVHDPSGNQIATHDETLNFNGKKIATSSWKVKVNNPQLWWPKQWGSQPLYSAQCNASTDAGLSDQTANTKFGIRSVTSKLDKKHNDTTFFVNDKPFQVLGAGYTSDIFLRFDESKLRTQFQYVLDMGLNTVRLEGKMEHPFLYDLADQMGIMILPGWECCDKWEGWSYNDATGPGSKWTDPDYAIANNSMLHEAAMMQAHPSILGFLVGSDYWPDDRATEVYTKALAAYNWDAPIISTAAQNGAPALLGNSGMKMAGPYDWVPPIYWYNDSQTDLGSAGGFGSELGAGVGTPELASLKKFLSQGDLDALWQHESKDKAVFHQTKNGSSFNNRSLYNDALYARYAPPTSLEDYLLKAQMADYEATRSQFEAYLSRWSTTLARPATGAIYWMLNSAWPSLHWNLFDYYLHPGGSFSGAKSALGSLQTPVYDYSDHSIYLVDRRLHSPPSESPSRTIEMEVISLDGKVLTKTNANATTQLNSSHKITSLPILSNVTDVVLLRLRLLSASNVLSRKVYWLAPKPDVLAWGDSDWYYTPVTSYANFTSLNHMATADLAVTTRGGSSSSSSSSSNNNNNNNNTLVLKNKGAVPAVFVRLNLVDGKGDDVLPVTWSDNYVSLWPGEEIEVRAGYARRAGGVRVEVSGKNVKASVVELGDGGSGSLEYGA